MTRRLLDRDVNEIFEEMCGTRDPFSSSSSARGPANLALRHRLPQIIDVDDHQERCLLGEEEDLSAMGSMTKGKKTHRRFAKCIGNYLSVCKINVSWLMGKKSRRAANSRPARNEQTKYEEKNIISCLGRSRRCNIRKFWGDIIKIEEEIVASVSRSVLYYA